MRPVLFTWRARPVPSYQAMLYVGIVAGLATGNVVANATGLNAARVYVASLLLLPIALLGARLAGVVAVWDHYRHQPDRIWRRKDGGQAMYGGLVMVPLSVPLLAALRVPFWAFWDIGGITMLPGMVFTRVGCLMNGCCAGRPTQSHLGMVLPDARGVRERRVPTQLLEAGLGATSLGVALAVIASPAPPGAAFAGGVAAYSVGRLLLQPLRDQQTRVGGLSALRLTSAGLLAAALLWTLARLT
jgi:phosphatidylglycerol---prolipoprotein diacylglyceryl transferase